MISPDCRLNTPSVLRRGGVGYRETEEVFAFYSVAANKNAPYPKEFKAYKEKEVVAALNDLFHRKCAYCESPYGGTQPVDVEHYRPKHAVVDERTKKLCYPGYPWLAANWLNLLPSCIDCNRAREQDTPDGAAVVGKASHFPLRDERRRARRWGDERKEKPLLLNPRRDRVERMFVYSIDGFILPNPSAPAADAERARKTIEVCGLFRSTLVAQRVSLLKKIFRDVEILRGHLELIDRNPGLRGGEKQLQRIVGKLQMYLEPGEPYTAMARQFIEPAIRELLS